MGTKCILIVIFASFTPIQGALPGTFFWRPRLGLDLSIPTTKEAGPGLTKQTVWEGSAVAVEGYTVGLTVLALASAISTAPAYLHMNPLSAYFYTNAYRWGLRHLTLIPMWLAGRSEHYTDTLKLWRRRFYYDGFMVPKWLRYLFPYVDAKEWDKEEQEYKLYQKHARQAFQRHYRYPSQVFNDYKSWETVETYEESDSSSSSSSKG